MDKLLAKNKQYIVLSCPEMDWLKNDLALKQIKWFIPGTIDWKTHPDGTPNLFIHDMEKLKNRHILFLASYHNYMAKYMQLAIIYVLTRSKIRTLTISLPFLDTATMERIQKEGQVATADVDCWLLSSLPRIGSPVEVIVYDIHTLQNRFYFHDGALLTIATGIEILKEYLEKYDRNVKPIVAFPDDGAQKRFGNMFSNYDQVVCKKVREDTKRYVSIASSTTNITGKHILIVDDLVQSGGTLLECRTGLITAGAASISAYVTHAIFPNESWKKMIGMFEEFIITNSCPVAQKLIRIKPFVVLSLTDNLIGHLLAKVAD